MNALILDGSHANDAMAPKITNALLAQLQARGWRVETVVVREQHIGNCAGGFLCWVRSPGVCNTNDDNRVVAEKIVRSDLLIYLTPVTFGGYSSALKRMVDHQIPTISPFFTRIDGETHHKPRYATYPDLLAVGWMDTPDAPAEAVFRSLVRRNAINMHARASAYGVVTGDPTGPELATRAAGWLDAIADAETLDAPALPEASSLPAEAARTQRAVLLVGSPRTRKSTSASLGGYLLEQLEARGVETTTLYVHTTFNTAERTQSALEKLDAADLVVLAFPLYVDSLPAPVIAALEKIAAHRAGRATPQRFAAIANCGFPETAHNATALAICAEFARQSGYSWAGGLALGGGEGIVHASPLEELGGRAHRIRASLESAAVALAVGEPIPQAARDLMARPVIPAWLYRLVGGLGWRQHARKYGAEKELRRRPYEPAGNTA